MTHLEEINPRLIRRLAECDKNLTFALQNKDWNVIIDISQKIKDLLDFFIVEAVKAGDLLAVKELLEKGASPDIKTSYSGLTTPLLHVATHLGRKDILETLIKAGARLTERDAMHRFASDLSNGKNQDCIDLIRHSGLKEERLIEYCAKGSIQKVKQLVQAGADINREIRGETGLLAAAKQGHDNIVKFLIQAGADPRLGLDKAQKTVLHYIAHFCSADNLQLVLDKGSLPLDQQDGLGKTPLHYAACSFEPDKVRILVHAGANVNIPDADDETPLYMACVARESPENAEILLNAGANPALKNIDRKLPL